MTNFHSVKKALLGATAGLGMLGASLLAPLSAAAQVAGTPLTGAQCQAMGGALGVAFFNIQGPDNVILTLQPDGTFAGAGIVDVFCRVPGQADPVGPITDASITVTVNLLPDAALLGAVVAVEGQVLTGPGDPSGTTTQILVPGGRITLDFTSPTAGLADLPQPFAIQIEAIASVPGVIFPPGFIVSDTGNLFAVTPELGSVALFGSGALGMAGYAFLRLRAQRRNQS